MTSKEKGERRPDLYSLWVKAERQLADAQVENDTLRAYSQSLEQDITTLGEKVMRREIENERLREKVDELSDLLMEAHARAYSP